MGKGRKWTACRSERFLGSYDGGHGQGVNSTESSELAEDDVWSMMGDSDQTTTGADSASEWSARASADSNGAHSNGSRRRVSRNGRHVGGLSLAFEETGKNVATPARIVDRFYGCEGVSTSCGRHMATSAPVNVPDWSKILLIDSVESCHDMDDGLDESESEMVPPHEYLARSRRTGTTSVFEGVGRTLKGRDLSRVRDAVWSQTGFDG